MKIYRGERIEGAPLVTVDGKPLPPGPSLKVWNHSPAGFEWGYAGSGPAQLALALLLDATGDPEYAEIMHQRFKFDVVCMFQSEQWTLSERHLLAWIAAHPQDE
jgi:hypothetical protein